MNDLRRRGGVPFGYRIENGKAVGGVEQRAHSARAYQLRGLPR